MKFSKDIEAFIKDFVIDLSENNVAIFAGAGMSRAAGFVNWPELLREIADELGLSVDKEHDLISIAQYHVNESGGEKQKSIKKYFKNLQKNRRQQKIIKFLPGFQLVHFGQPTMTLLLKTH